MLFKLGPPSKSQVFESPKKVFFGAKKTESQESQTKTDLGKKLRKSQNTKKKIILRRGPTRKQKKELFGGLKKPVIFFLTNYPSSKWWISEYAPKEVYQVIAKKKWGKKSLLIYLFLEITHFPYEDLTGYIIMNKTLHWKEPTVDLRNLLGIPSKYLHNRRHRIKITSSDFKHTWRPRLVQTKALFDEDRYLSLKEWASIRMIQRPCLATRRP